MKIPTIRGIIDRRILINYSIDQDILAGFLPEPFRPKTVGGRGIVGICLIRLRAVRPKGFPDLVGISSENAAHRMAVEWSENGIQKEGVYIPRRDSSSYLNALAGGRIFPGVHNKSNFLVDETDVRFSLELSNEDGTSLSLKAKAEVDWPKESIFKTLKQASDFFENGAIGYSPTKQPSVYDGLKLKTFNWKVSPLTVEKVKSSFFDDDRIFPKGSIKFDNALLMTNIDHEWRGLPQIKN